jgi:hypothetical protein
MKKHTRDEILTTLRAIRDTEGGDGKPWCCWQEVIDGDASDTAVMAAVGGCYSRAGAFECKCTKLCNALGSLFVESSQGERKKLLDELRS